MAFEFIKAEISLLVGKLTDHPADRRELEFQLREKLNEMRALGMPLPADLVALEQELDEELEQEAREAARNEQAGKPE